MATIKSDQLDEEEAAVLKAFDEIRDWGFGRMEVIVVNRELETLIKSQTYKKRDLIKPKTT